MSEGEVLTYLLGCALLLLVIEWQTRQVATIRWVLLAVLWVIVVGMLISAWWRMA